MGSKEGSKVFFFFNIPRPPGSTLLPHTTLFRSSLRYIGGYGRMSWVSRDAWLEATPDPLAADADGIVSHMNGDHADAMVAYCKSFSRATDITVATMTGVDRYGFEMSAVTDKGPRPEIGRAHV